AHLDRVPDVINTVEVTGDDQTVNFELSLTPVSEQVTVTATGSAESVGTSYHSVVSVGALEVAQRNPLSIGDAIESQPGVAKRSFGPGSVVRLFADSMAIACWCCRMDCASEASLLNRRTKL